MKVGIVGYAKQHGLSVISMIGDRMYHDFEQHIEVYDPRQYLGIIKEAKAVFADSFVSAFLGILFDKGIAANDTKLQSEKNYRLLSTCQRECHFSRKVKGMAAF